MSVDFQDKKLISRQSGIEFFGAWPKENLARKVVNSEMRSNTPADETLLHGRIQCNHHALRNRQKLQRENSLSLIPEYPLLEDVNATREAEYKLEEKYRAAQPIHAITQKKRNFNILTFMLNFTLNITLILMRYILFIPLSIAAPSFWLSVVLWIFWKFLGIPLSLAKWIYSTVGNRSISENSSIPRKRTILISSGSTIQALHLARNFYSTGARVIVFEIEEFFPLARFSAAVDKFYVVPRPTVHNTSSYIDAICHIVRKEKPSIYIPVCVTSPAYYDALAKPYLELLGCATFLPGLKETTILDDCMQFFQKCSSRDIQLPAHRLLHSKDELFNLYDNGFIGNCRIILEAVGMNGILNRKKLILPNNKRELKFNHEISEQHPWLLIRDLPGDHFITCTTVKDSRVVANVTCSIEHDTKKLIPLKSIQSDKALEENEIENWIKTFFARVRFQRSINGHFSFRLVRCQMSGKFVPLGIRVGVSMPFICYNQSHSQILCRTVKCVHMMPIGLYKDEEESVLNVWKKNIASIALDKREALFTYWDPLPYSAFYHFQLPLESVKLLLQKRCGISKNNRRDHRFRH